MLVLLVASSLATLPRVASAARAPGASSVLAGGAAHSSSGTPRAADTPIASSTAPRPTLPGYVAGSAPSHPEPYTTAVRHALYLGQYTPPTGTPTVGLSELGRAGSVNYSVGTGWIGLNSNYPPNPCGCEPPDTNGAVGNGYVFETVNAAGQIWTEGGTSVSSFALNSFFGSSGNGNPDLSDPVVHYDPMSSRWVAEILSVDNYGISFLAVSASANPSGSWYQYEVEMPNHNGTSGDLPDQINVGISSQAIVLSGNDFPGAGGYSGAVLFVVNKSQALAGTAPQYVLYGPWPSFASVHAALEETLSPTVYFLSSFFGSTTTLNYVTETGAPPGAVHFAFANYTTNSAAPPCAPAPGGNCVVTNDNRIGSATWLNGTLWAAANDGNCAGGVSSCLHFWELSTSTATVLQDFVWTPPGGENGYFPALSLDTRGDVGVLYSYSNSTVYPSVAITGQAAGDPHGTMEPPTGVERGTAIGSSTGRFGDYSGVQTDLTTGAFWGFGEWIGADSWDTWVQSWSFHPGTEYPVTFDETGLPSGTTWYVNLTNGQSFLSSSSNLTFSEPNGSYTYSVASANPGYAAPGGSFVVNGSAVTKAVTFVAVFVVTFSESGLPYGTPWWVNLTNGQSFRSTTLSLRFSEPNGVYAYSVATSNKVYRASGGSFTVSGAPVPVAVAFSPVTYSATLTESGLPGGTEWWWNISGHGSHNSTGTSINWTLSNGTYFYTLAAAAFGYSAPGGTLVVAGGPVSRSATFRYVVFTVTFDESGLASGTEWWVNVTGIGSLASNASSLHFIAPNGTYAYHPSASAGRYSAPDGSVTVVGASVNLSLAFALVVYNVTIHESGLPAGTAWWVNGTAGPSGELTAASVVLPEPNGSYSYWIGSANPQYSAPGGGFTVSGAPETVNVTFHELVYLVTFTAQGLPSGTEWWLNLTGGPSFASHGTAIAFSEPNGSYPYSVEARGGYHPSAANGSVRVDGAARNLTVSFSSGGSGGFSLFGLSTPASYAVLALIVVIVAALVAIALARRGRRKQGEIPSPPPPSA